MTTLNVSLPEEMKAFIEAQMAREGFLSADEYLRALVREAQRRQAKRELEAKIREAYESGPAQPMTREDWDELERRVRERHRRELAKPKPDVRAAIEAMKQFRKGRTLGGLSIRELIEEGRRF